MAGFDLSSVITSASNLLGLQTQLGNQQVKQLQDTQDMVEGIASGQERIGSLTSQAERIRLMGALETEQARLSAATSAGTNIGATSDVLTPLLQSLRGQALEFSAAQAKVTEIESNSDLINNPLGWLRDLVQGDQARSQRDALATQFDATNRQVTALNQATQASVATQNAIQTSLTAASVNDLAEANALEAQLKAQATRVEGMKFGIDAINTMRQVGQDNFRTMTATYGLIVDDQRWREGFELRKESLAQARAARRDRESEQSYYEEQTSRINNYLSYIGRPPMAVDEVKRTLTAPGGYGDTVRDWQVKGFQMEETGGMGVFGVTPSEVINTLRRDQPRLPETYNSGAGKILQQAQALADTEVASARLTDKTAYKDPAAYAALYDSSAKAAADTFAKDIQPSTGNPLQAPAISTVLSELPDLAATPFAQKILSPLAETGANEVNPEVILATGAKAVQAGEMTMDQFVKGYTEFFKGAVNIRNATGGYLQLGINPGVGYKAKIPAFEPSFLQRFGPGALLTAGTPGSGIAITQVARRISGQEGSAIVPSSLASTAIDHTDPKDVTLAATTMISRKFAEEIISAQNR